MNESEKTIQKQTENKLSEKPREIPNLQKQIDKTFHTAKIQLAAPVTMIFGLFVLGVILIFRQNLGAGITFCIIAIALIPLFVYLFNFTNKKVTVPDELKNYMASFSPEQFFSARDMERLPDHPGLLELSQPMEYQQENRYGIIQQHVGKSMFVVAVVFPLGFAIPALISSPYYWYFAAGSGVISTIAALLGYISYTKMTVFDFHEKKIFYDCRRFHPENTGKMKSVSFSEIDHLSLALFEIERHTKSGTVQEKYIGLLAVKSDGDGIPLCKASKTNFPWLLALLPDLAEKMGHLVITHF